MTIKKEVLKTFNDTVRISELRLSASKVALVSFSFLFFINYFLVSFEYNLWVAKMTLPFTYTAFIFSFLLFWYLYFARFIKSFLFKVLYLILLSVMFIFTIIPILLPGFDFLSLIP